MIADHSEKNLDCDCDHRVAIAIAISAIAIADISCDWMGLRWDLITSPGYDPGVLYMGIDILDRPIPCNKVAQLERNSWPPTLF